MRDQSLPPPGPAALPAAAASGPVLGPAVLLHAVRKNWPLILLSVCLAVAGTVAYTARQIRIYQAIATVQFDPQPLMPLGNQPTGESGPESYWSNQEYFSTQHQVLTSRKIASLVVARLSLHRDAGFVAGAPPGSNPSPVNVSLDGAAELLRSRITVKPIADSRLATVSYQDADPERAQRVLSALVDVYVEQNLDGTLDSATKRAEWLDTQLGKLKTDLESQEMDLHDFKERNNLLSVSFDDQSNMLRAEIQQLNTNLTDLKTRREHIASRLAVLKQISPNDPALIPGGELLGSASLATLRTAYVTAKLEVDRVTAVGKGENHPEARTAQVALKSAHDALLTELGNIRQGVEADLQAVERELGGVAQLFEGAKKQAMGLHINEVRFTRLRRTKDNTERVFGLVLERSTESGLSKLMPFNNVRVLDRPLKPGGPISPRPFTNLAVGTVLGLLLGLVGAVSRELLDRTIRSAEDAEQELGLSSLGSLPDTSGRNAKKALRYGAYYGRGKHAPHEPEAPPGTPDTELIVHTHPKSAAAEAARAVRTNLLFMSPDKPYRTLLVTSAGPAEGKTTVATSIAIAMAQTGQRVCLVDCDLRRPRVHSLFNLTLSSGLTTVLLDPERLDEAMQSTAVPNLSVLPSGPTPPNPADIMHSVAFSQLIESLKARFDRVVIDSPPVCLVTDAVVASTKVDAAILVIRARKTRREGAKRALRALRSVSATLPGFVFNAVMVKGERYEYTYYHASDRPDDAEPSPNKA